MAGRKAHAGRLSASRLDAPPKTTCFPSPASYRVPPYRPEAARPAGPHDAESPYRPDRAPSRHCRRGTRPAASCGVLRGVPPFRLRLSPSSPSRPYSALHGVLRRHFRHAPAYPSYCLSPSADSPGISMQYGDEPCVTQAGRRIGFSSYLITSVSHWYPNSCRYACLSCSNWAALSENAWCPSLSRRT